MCVSPVQISLAGSLINCLEKHSFQQPNIPLSFPAPQNLIYYISPFVVVETQRISVCFLVRIFHWWGTFGRANQMAFPSYTSHLAELSYGIIFQLTTDIIEVLLSHTPSHSPPARRHAFQLYSLLESWKRRFMTSFGSSRIPSWNNWFVMYCSVPLIFDAVS